MNDATFADFLRIEHDRVIEQIMRDGCPHCNGLPFVWSGGTPLCPRCRVPAACEARPAKPS